MKLDGVAHTSSTNGLNPSKASETLSNEVKQQNEIQKNNPKENELGNEKLSKKTIKDAIENTNRKLVSTDRKFEFSINEETNDVIIRVINKETDEVIREIPSEKILDMVAKMMELAGLFIDEKR